MATSSQTDENLSLALLNINGLRNKIPYIQHIIAEHKLHVVALCETKLDSSVLDSQVYLEGFRMWRRDRNCYGGGVALYVQDHIKTRLRSDLIKTQVEMIWVEMELPGSRPVLLGCCYRPPNARVEYLNQIKEIMTLVSKEEKDILLMGDFNVDCKSEDRKNTSFMSDLGLSQIVEDFTRVDTDKKTQTCIDHIYTNIPEQCFTPQSIPTYFSDHNLVKVQVSRRVPKWTRNIRSKQFDKKSFQTKIQNAQWGKVSEESDPKKALSLFTKTFISELNDCAPLSAESKDIYGLLRLGNDLRNLYLENDERKGNQIKYLDSGKDKTSGQKRNREGARTSEGNEATQKRSNTKTHAEKDELKTLLEEFKDYLGESFPSRVISITPDGDVTSEADHVVNLHQTNTGTTDPECVSEGSQVQQIRQAGLEAFSFREIDADTVHGWLVHLCDHVIYEIDQTEAEMMKLAADHISGPISHILNRCCLTGMFPDELKKIKTFRFSANSYICSRQNSEDDRVHLMLSYILDGVLYDQVKKFCVEKQLIPSASLDKIKPTKNVWLTASENGQKVGAVFLDLNSSFNNISGDLLKNTLRTSGFSPQAISLIEGFFSSRGLPSGSFLGQLLFTIFVNDLKKVLTKPSAVVSDGHVNFSLTIETIRH